MKPVLATILLAVRAAFAGYVQHLPVDLADARSNFPLRVARGEKIELSVDFHADGEALDISGCAVALYTQTNGMPASVAWRTDGEARGSGAVFFLDVDAVLPGPAGRWSVTVADGSNVIARAGGAAYVRGTAAAESSAVPIHALEDALAPYATTNYVADYVSAHAPTNTPGGVDADEVAAIVAPMTNGLLSHAEAADTFLTTYVPGTYEPGDEGSLAGIGYSSDGSYDYYLAAHVDLVGFRDIIADYGDVTIGGKTAPVTHRLSEKMDKSKKELHADSRTNIVWQTCYENGWVFLRAYTNDLEVAE